MIVALVGVLTLVVPLPSFLEEIKPFGRDAASSITSQGSSEPNSGREPSAALSSESVEPVVEPTPVAQEEKPFITKFLLEDRIHQAVNDERLKHALKQLSYDPALAGIGRKHSEDMAECKLYSHTNLSGQGPKDRADVAGYVCTVEVNGQLVDRIGENLFRRSLYNSITPVGERDIVDWATVRELAETTVIGWMNSPSHRQNILTSSYTKEGIGVRIVDPLEVFVTQVFC